METEYFKQVTGREGSEIIASGSTIKPTPGKVFFLLVCIDATTINAATTSNVRNISGQAFPAGHPIYGHFSQVHLTSGRVQAFETDK